MQLNGRNSAREENDITRVFGFLVVRLNARMEPSVSLSFHKCDSIPREFGLEQAGSQADLGFTDEDWSASYAWD